MSMYNLMEQTSNFPDMIGSLWLYSEDEATNFNNDIGNTENFKSFKYRTEILGDSASALG